MPFPEPFALGTIIVLIFVVISTNWQNLFRKVFSPPGEKPSAPEQIETTYDPFADPPQTDPNPSPIQIVTKYVEVGSTTEELTFDWIASPFGSQHGNKGDGKR